MSMEPRWVTGNGVVEPELVVGVRNKNLVFTVNGPLGPPKGVLF